MKKIVGVVLIQTALFSADNLAEAFSNVSMDGTIRMGVVHTENSAGKKARSATLGGNMGIETESLYGISLGARFYTTNALFGKDNEPMFLDSKGDSYSILGEAYIRWNMGNTSLKAGRQVLETPYINSDDVGMIQNTFEGYRLQNRDIPDTLLSVGLIDRWAGIDSSKPEGFTKLQSSHDAVIMASIIYEGLDNTTLQAWQYKFDNADFNYFEAGYETDTFNIGIQYSNQDHGNNVFGLTSTLSQGAVAFTVAYNKVDGIVTNGFGGGPFFTSAEDHTIEIDELNQEGIMGRIEYVADRFSLALNHAHFEVGEDDTDYIASYVMSDEGSLDFIYSDLYGDGKLIRFFANYSF